MKILVVYSSKTGNTRKIARAIADALPAADLAAVEDRPDASAYDIVFMGFWVDKGSADGAAQAYMTTIGAQHVALFATLGAYPDSQHAVDSLDNAAKLLPDAVLIDRFICQGAIDPKLIDWMKQLPPEHPHAPDEARVQRWRDAAGHPDATDCRSAADWAADLIAHGCPHR